MTVKIDQKITGWSVVKPGETDAPKEEAQVVQMHEKIKRPEHLHGSTYKLKAPNIKHALYVSINDIVLNEGTEHEKRAPFEIFINCRDMDNYQWVTALTLVLSAIFRKGGDVTFIIDELEQVFDPKGGYFTGGRFVPSLVAEIGIIIKRHMRSIGLIPEEVMDEGQLAYLEEKKARAMDADPGDTGYPKSATLCKACSVKAVIIDGGCATCLSCGDSKCS
ncbi:hypothetical protein [Congregibacter litoralis]|uniref:ribonucleoside-diphosphate reductase n=1 Tax=Congregibacter litoralis KT71 TaxID=314285 RepID=A4A8K8_9GAMM|nr:hypothetical protein [Congregibacter litoralis]EAQ97400.1 TSCPD domain protein [Congregibacter litoralis KT71]